MRHGPDRRTVCVPDAAAAPLAPATASLSTAGALPFFLRASPGQRFCMYYPPAQGRARRGALLYVHPFGEELSKSRRMAALQARAFAASGYAVLQIDLYGCGDSSGDFGAARWHIWKHDLMLAWEWLARQERGPVSLWGLRLGCLLVLDLSRQAPAPPQRMILWHPVLCGTSFLHQLLAPAAAQASTGRDQQATWLRQQLEAGLPVDVGGDTLAPELAAAIALQEAAATTPDCPVLWLEQAGAGDADAARASARHLAGWRGAGVAVQMHALHGAAFWSSRDIVECQALLAATAALDA